MRRLLTLSLDEFGAAAIEEQTAHYSLTPAELARRAARYYMSDLGSGRMALRVPRLDRRDTARRSMRLAIDLDADSWRELEAEARRQDVTVEALVVHAILYFLADLDSGRVGRRILEDESA
jgi:hypothetical protein